MSRYVAYAIAACCLACNAPSFDPESKVETVRILATSADKPYAAPGDTVNMKVLAVDGRASKVAPMNVFWLPGACVDPPGDAYYACFSSLADVFAPSADLGPELTAGTTFSFRMPSNAITGHDGGGPYGVAFLFSVACAGHVQYLPPALRSSNAPDAVPLGCFDAAGTQLGADDFVFAYSTVYAFASLTNANPVIQDVMWNGKNVDPNAGISLPHCTQATEDACPSTLLDVDVPPSSQETDPSDVDTNGKVLGEEIYVNYYLTGGKVDNDVAVLYDPRAGRLANTAVKFFAPLSPGVYTLWTVVHDNRGGVSWQELPLHAE